MVSDYILSSIQTKQKLLLDEAFLRVVGDASEIIKSAVKNGNKVLIAGNGGSAADSQHFAAELIGRYKTERRAYPAIALTTDTSILTAWSNDYEFETVFSRQIEALGREDDVFVGISTSGNSKNIIQAIETAKNIGMKTISLLGRDGGKTKGLADISIVVSSELTSHIQEVHIMLIHIFSEALENM